MLCIIALVFPCVFCLSAASTLQSSHIPTTQTQQSTSSDVSACEADCAAHLNFYISYGWQSYAINTTITAATLQKIVYPKYNTTKTRLLQNDLPPGYTLPDRNGEGTVVSTLTVDRGRRGKLTTALAYPTGFTEYAQSYWWTGIRPTAAPGSPSCITQLAPATVQLPSHRKDIKRRKETEEEVTLPLSAATNNPILDGSNYQLIPRVVRPNVNLYHSASPSDPILAQCRVVFDSDIVASADEVSTKTGAFFVTMTEVRTEIHCPPDIACAVRRESSETGPLVAPSPAQTVPPPPPTATGTEVGQMGKPNTAMPKETKAGTGAAGAAAPKANMSPGIMADKNRPMGSAGVGGVMGALTVKTEKTATALAIPSATIKKAPGGSGDDTNMPPIESLQPMQPMISKGDSPSSLPPLPPLVLTSLVWPLGTPLPPPVQPETPLPTLGSVTNTPTEIGSLTLGGTPVAIALVPPRITAAPKGQPPPLEIQIGTQTARIGETVTVNNVPVAVTTNAGGSAIAIVRNDGAGVNNIQDSAIAAAAAAKTFLLRPSAPAVLLGSAAAAVAAGDKSSTPRPAIAAAAAAAAQQPPVTVASAVLTPNSDGGYSVSGQSLAIGGSAVTLRGSGTSTPVVLSLTADSSGRGVVVANGQSTTLDGGSMSTTAPATATTGGLKPSARASSTSSRGAGEQVRIDRCFGFWGLFTMMVALIF